MPSQLPIRQSTTPPGIDLLQVALKRSRTWAILDLCTGPMTGCTEGGRTDQSGSERSGPTAASPVDGRGARTRLACADLARAGLDGVSRRRQGRIDDLDRSARKNLHRRRDDHHDGSLQHPRERSIAERVMKALKDSRLRRTPHGGPGQRRLGADRRRRRHRPRLPSRGTRVLQPREDVGRRPAESGLSATALET